MKSNSICLEATIFKAIAINLDEIDTLCFYFILIIEFILTNIVKS